MPKVTHKMLTSSLSESESEGFIHREVYPVVPPKVEYSLTDRGKKSIPIISQIREYGFELVNDPGIWDSVSFLAGLISELVAIYIRMANKMLIFIAICNMNHSIQKQWTSIYRLRLTRQ